MCEQSTVPASVVQILHNQGFHPMTSKISGLESSGNDNCVPLSYYVFTGQANQSRASAFLTQEL